MITKTSSTVWDSHWIVIRIFRLAKRTVTLPRPFCTFRDGGDVTTSLTYAKPFAGKPSFRQWSSISSGSLSLVGIGELVELRAATWAENLQRTPCFPSVAFRYHAHAPPVWWWSPAELWELEFAQPHRGQQHDATRHAVREAIPETPCAHDFSNPVGLLGGQPEADDCTSDRRFW